MKREETVLRFHFRCAVLLTCLCGFTGTAWSQDAVLKGKVWDPIANAPIAAADVNVSGPDGKPRVSTISGADGQYSLTGLKRGERVNVSWSCGGYSRWAELIPLTAPETTKNVSLLKQTASAAYWEKWSLDVKGQVDAKTADPAARVNLYADSWTNLKIRKLSPEAQAEAARQLLDVAPQASRSNHLLNFATVKMDVLKSSEAEIRSAMVS